MAAELRTAMAEDEGMLRGAGAREVVRCLEPRQLSIRRILLLRVQGGRRLVKGRGMKEKEGIAGQQVEGRHPWTVMRHPTIINKDTTITAKEEDRI